MTRRQRWRRVVLYASVILSATPPFVLGRTILAVMVGLPVALATGLLTLPFWPEDHFWTWQTLEIRRRWMTAFGIKPLTGPDEANRWLAENPDRHDEWFVSGLLIAQRFEEAQAALSSLPAPTTEWQTFSRKSAASSLEFHAHQPVDLQGLLAAARAIEDPEARTWAEAQAAVVALSLSVRGDISRAAALAVVRKVNPELKLPIRERPRLWLAHFPGIVVVLVVLLLWILMLAFGVGDVALAQGPHVNA